MHQVTERRPPSEFELRRLTGDDVDAIVHLYEAVFRVTRPGFLARRDRKDFEQAFQAENVAAGFFIDERLIGYQIHNTVAELRFDEAKFKQAAAIVGSGRVLFGKGTVIAVEHEGSGLATRISAFVADLARSQGFRYRIGQVHVDNIKSIKYVLSGGRTIIGISTDEFGLNFISCGYFGPRSVISESGSSCDLRDIDRVASLLERERMVSMRSREGRTYAVFASVEELA